MHYLAIFDPNQNVKFFLIKTKQYMLSHSQQSRI